jgi:nucleotide-binding universal stress UspA family protein
MKQFKTEVLTVKPADESLHIPDNKLMKEFIKRHYPDAEYLVLRGNPEDEVFRYLHHQKGEPIVVLGAYSRSKLSRLLKPSMADYILQHIKMPLFIAHT